MHVRKVTWTDNIKETTSSYGVDALRKCGRGRVKVLAGGTLRQRDVLSNHVIVIS